MSEEKKDEVTNKPVSSPEEKEEKAPRNPIQALLDEKDTAPVSLFNEKGEETKFEQIAIIPIEKKVYAVLKPLNPLEGMSGDEALVFEIIDRNDEGPLDEGYLNLVSDIDTIDKVFDIYNKLIDEQEDKTDK